MRCPEVELFPDAPAPDVLFGGLPNHRYVIWLDSADRRADTGRFSFLAVDPFLVVRSDAGGAAIETAEGTVPTGEPALTTLRRLLRQFRTDTIPDLPPFQGGAAGYIGYELARELERLPRVREPGLGIPDMELCFYDLVVAWDHASDSCWILSTGWPEPGRAGERRARLRLEAGRHWLEGRGEAPGPTLPAGEASPDPPPPQAATGRFQISPKHGLSSSFTRESYTAAVARAIEYILAGDIFQVNLSQRFELPAPGDVVQLYAGLRRHNPGPFGCFFAGQGAQVLSSSPERFLRCSAGGSVETRPIKGTRPRSHNPDTDRDLARALRASRKDLAENLMIVDLLRNDLSRVCEPGTIRVPELFRLESYQTVHHLVSVVTGQLEAGADAVDLLSAAFPGGSVTGAPKIRAMEIIAELEPVPRGPYCGAIGYIGFDGAADTSIAIRTVVGAAERCYLHAGGAVVADSDPDDEYEETLHKSAGLLSALGVDPMELLAAATDRPPDPARRSR